MVSQKQNYKKFNKEPICSTYANNIITINKSTGDLDQGRSNLEIQAAKVNDSKKSNNVGKSVQYEKEHESVNNYVAEKNNVQKQK